MREQLVGILFYIHLIFLVLGLKSSRFLIASTSHKKQKNGDRNSHYNLRQYRTINRMKSYEKGITSCHPCQDLP